MIVIDQVLKFVESAVNKYFSIQNLILLYIIVMISNAILFSFYSTYQYTHQAISYLDFQINVVIALIVLSSAVTVAICSFLISLKKEEQNSLLINK